MTIPPAIHRHKTRYFLKSLFSRSHLINMATPTMGRVKSSISDLMRYASTMRATESTWSFLPVPVLVMIRKAAVAEISPTVKVYWTNTK